VKHPQSGLICATYTKASSDADFHQKIISMCEQCGISKDRLQSQTPQIFVSSVEPSRKVFPVNLTAGSRSLSLTEKNGIGYPDPVDLCLIRDG